MPLISLEKFKQDTSVGGDINKRGSALIHVDVALEAWWKRNPNDLDAAISLLYHLIKGCNKWYRGTKPPKGVKASALYYRRKHEIEKLGQSALDLLKSISPETAAAYEYYQERKAGGQESHLRSLAKGYHLEREWYLAVGKKEAYAASNVRPMFTSVQSRPHKYIKDVRKIGKKKSFTDLNLSDFSTLAAVGGGELVTYYNKIQRLQFLAIPNNGLFVNISDKPIHMDEWNPPFGPGRPSYPRFFMYAVDHYGNLYTHPQPPDIQEKVWFNHSSFTGGRKVMCAGFIWIAKGVLKHIDNNSGHYKPTRKDLQRTLRYFEAEGIGMDDVRVIDYTWSETKEMFANTFLNNILGANYTELDERRNGLVR